MSTRCHATTVKGEQCKRSTRNGPYCNTHAAQHTEFAGAVSAPIRRTVGRSPKALKERCKSRIEPSECSSDPYCRWADKGLFKSKPKCVSRYGKAITGWNALTM